MRIDPRALAAIPLLLAPACKLVSEAANAPSHIASGLLGGGEKPTERVPPNVLQAGVMRFADTFSARITQATQEFADRAGTPEAKIQAMSWSIGQSTSAFTIASGPNANIALLDMIVLVTLGRMVHEEYWLPKVWGEADRPMLETFEALEVDVWIVAGQMLTEEQRRELKKTLEEWRAENPDMGITAFVRLPAFREIAKVREAKGGGMGNALGDLLSVDPLSGLEPAVREIEQTRLFGERSMFYLQRAPILLSNQIELLGLKLMARAELNAALEDGRRISEAAASLAKTAETLPESFRVEREAAVKQVSDELARQRQGLIADLESAREPAQAILAEAHGTLEAGERMSAALEKAIAALDGFIAGLRAPKEEPGAAPATPEEPGKPFDVVEYGQAAERVEAAARELHGLVGSLDEGLPKVDRALDGAVERSDRIVDHAFVRGLQLGGILIAAAALAALATRWISVRVIAPRPALQKETETKAIGPE